MQWIVNEAFLYIIKWLNCPYCDATFPIKKQTNLKGNTTTQLVVEQTHCGRRYVYRRSIILPVTSRLNTRFYSLSTQLSRQWPGWKKKTSATKMRVCSSIYSASRVYWWIEKNLLWSLGDGAEGNKQHSGTLVGKTILLVLFFLLFCAGWPNNKPKPPFLRCACVSLCNSTISARGIFV